MLMELEFLLEPHKDMPEDQMHRVAQHVAFKNACKQLGFDVDIAYDESRGSMQYMITCANGRRVFNIDLRGVMLSNVGLIHYEAIDLVRKAKSELDSRAGGHTHRCPRCGEPAHRDGKAFICGSYQRMDGVFVQTDQRHKIQVYAQATKAARDNGQGWQSVQDERVREVVLKDRIMQDIMRGAYHDSTTT